MTEDLYSVHPAVLMVQSAIAGLPAKTGRSLEAWVRLVQEDGPAGEAERVRWLKAEHGLGTNYAAWIAARAGGKGEDGRPETYLREAAAWVEAMYAGPK